MAGYWRPATTTDLNDPNVKQNDSGQIWDTRTLPSELKTRGTMEQLGQALATGGDLSAIGFSEVSPNASAGLADNRTQLQNLQKINPGGSVITGPDGKQYWQYNPGSFGDAGLSGQGSTLGDFLKSPVGIGLMAAGGAGLMGGFAGFGGAEAAVGEGFGDAAFGTNAFDFGGVTGTTPLTGGGGFGSSLSSSISSLTNMFTGSGISPTQALSLAQKIAGATGGNGMATTSTGGASVASPFSGLVSAGAGLFDIFSQSPYSSQGITSAAAGTADPLMGDRAGYGGMLKEMMTNPDSFMLSPAAKSQMKYGTENLMRSDAAKGLLGSGNILADITQFGQGVASQDYWKQLDELNLLSGAKTGSPAAAGQLMSGNLTNRNNALSNIGGGLTAANPLIASIMKSLGITDPSTYTAGNTGAANGYTYSPGDANMPGDLSMDVPYSGSTLTGGFGEAAGNSAIEDMFAFA